MKKILSMLLAASMTIAMAATSLAQNDGMIELGSDSDSGFVLNASLLEPGETYRFPVKVSVDGGEAVELTEELLDDYHFRINNTGEGKSLSSAKLVKSGGVYCVEIEVKAGWPAEQTAEEYTFKLVSKADGKTNTQLNVQFDTGYGIVDDAVIDALDKEDYIEVNNDTPVYTAEQLERIAKRNNYKKVVFSGDNWTYEVNVTDMGNVNMLNNNDAVKEILTKYENNSFEFLNFPAATTFTTSGTVEIDVSDFSEQFEETFYVYRYLNGKLTQLAASYDTETDILSFNTKTLGRFVIADHAITDAVVVPENSGSTGSGSGSAVTPQNPSTGAAA